MSDLAIKVENISKLYQLGQIGTGSFKNDVIRFWSKFKGIEDPFQKIGIENDRSKKAISDWVWALRDIDFNVKIGEVLGIIGRNGAGKSTLLKILSQITAPTTGKIILNGKIASLLEVGTGFHPELSGRDNIFLNGSILGMKKSDIKSKFDQIVDFSGVEGYIDTPVKRYSSGMYVRLAFAVAAHLETDILIVDEVLAVGDLEFQKKCLTKIQTIANSEGKTVIFVSHNMAAVEQMCENILILKNGNIDYSGNISDGLKHYYQDNNAKCNPFFNNSLPQNSDFLEVKIKKVNEKSASPFFRVDDEIQIDFKLVVEQKSKGAIIGFCVKDYREKSIFTSEVLISNFIERDGIYNLTSKIPSNTLVPGLYSLFIALHLPNIQYLSKIDNVLSFEVLELGNSLNKYKGADYGCVFVNCTWEQT